MGIVDIDMQYTSDDIANLVTYKLFNQKIRPMLLEKNPKLAMYKMVSLISAKWREFMEHKKQTSPPNTAGELEQSSINEYSSPNSTSKQQVKPSAEEAPSKSRKRKTEIDTETGLDGASSKKSKKDVRKAAAAAADAIKSENARPPDDNDEEDEDEDGDENRKDR